MKQLSYSITTAYSLMQVVMRLGIVFQTAYTFWSPESVILHGICLCVYTYTVCDIVLTDVELTNYLAVTGQIVGGLSVLLLTIQDGGCILR